MGVMIKAPSCGYDHRVVPIFYPISMAQVALGKYVDSLMACYSDSPSKVRMILVIDNTIQAAVTGAYTHDLFYLQSHIRDLDNVYKNGYDYHALVTGGMEKVDERLKAMYTSLVEETTLHKTYLKIAGHGIYYFEDEP